MYNAHVMNCVCDKSGYSTETVLVRVKKYIIMSIDQGKPIILVLLDLSAAFDIVDHNVLFSLG